MATLWITEQEVKDLTQIQQNVDGYLFENEIKYCQKANIESCLTDEMIARIQAVVDGVVDADITTLLDDYIKPALANHVFVSSLPNIAIRVANKGVFFKQDNTNVNGGQDAVDYLRNEHIHRAGFYTNQMLKYIKDNPDLFPEQDNCPECEDKEGFNFGMDYIAD